MITSQDNDLRGSRKMNERQKKAVRHIVLGVALLIVAGAFYWYGNRAHDKVVVASFEECVAAGYPVMESYPRKCRIASGETFTENIGNELEKDDLIRIESPRPNAVIQSPLTVKGVARGYWFFEASFPVTLLDGEGNQIAQGIAQAQNEWMTEKFVPFEAILTFSKSNGERGTLVLEKDNPSGLPEHADALRVPVRFR